MKEKGAILVMERTGEKFITHDDKLVFFAEKTISKNQSEQQKERNRLLCDEWFRCMSNKYVDGLPVITGYYREGKDGKKYISNNEFSRLLEIEKRFFKPIYAKELWIEKNKLAKLESKGNELYLILYNLYESLASRYKMALNGVIELENKGVISYRGEGKEREKVEALRNRLIRRFLPYEYEHNILLNGELASKIHKELEHKAKNNINGTLYLAGFNKYKGREYKIKLYWVEKREGEKLKKTLKIETTIFRPFFKKQGITAKNLTKQPEIQEKIIYKKLLDLISLNVVGKLSGVLKGEIMEGLGVVENREREKNKTITKKLLEVEGTLTERVTKLERETENLKTRLDNIDERFDNIDERLRLVEHNKPPQRQKNKKT